jgi:hypothetical protein
LKLRSFMLSTDDSNWEVCPRDTPITEQIRRHFLPPTSPLCHTDSWSEDDRLAKYNMQSFNDKTWHKFMSVFKGINRTATLKSTWMRWAKLGVRMEDKCWPIKHFSRRIYSKFITS